MHHRRFSPASPKTRIRCADAYPVAVHPRDLRVTPMSSSDEEHPGSLLRFGCVDNDSDVPLSQWKEVSASHRTQDDDLTAFDFLSDTDASDYSGQDDGRVGSSVSTLLLAKHVSITSLFLHLQDTDFYGRTPRTINVHGATRPYHVDGLVRDFECQLHGPVGARGTRAGRTGKVVVSWDVLHFSDESDAFGFFLKEVFVPGHVVTEAVESYFAGISTEIVELEAKLDAYAIGNDEWEVEENGWNEEVFENDQDPGYHTWDAEDDCDYDGDTR